MSINIKELYVNTEFVSPNTGTGDCRDEKELESRIYRKLLQELKQVQKRDQHLQSER